MASCYAHSLVHSSTLVREAPSCNRWLLTQTHITSQAAETERLCAHFSAPNRTFISHSLLSLVTGDYEMRLGRMVKGGGGG